MPIGQGERWGYTDEENVGNPEKTIAQEQATTDPVARSRASQAILDATAAAALADQKANKDLTDLLVGAIKNALATAGLRAIEPVAALPALPDAAYPAGTVVLLTTTNVLYRSTGTAWTASVSAADIAGQITETQITDLAISTPKLAAGAVVASKIDVATLSAISANVGTVTAGVLQNQTGTAKFDLSNSRIIFDNGTVVKITGLGFGLSSQFIEWVGLRAGILSGGVVNVGLCDESNAIQYITINGDAFFKGQISTSNLGVTLDVTSVSGSAASDTVPPASNTTATTGAVTATPSGGSAPYSYLWQQVDGTAATPNAPTAATTTFDRTALAQSPANVVTGRYRCRITDNVGDVVYTAPVTVTTSHLYEPV